MSAPSSALTIAALSLVFAACGTTPAPPPDIRATLAAASLTPAAIVDAMVPKAQDPTFSFVLGCGTPCLGPATPREEFVADVIQAVDGDTVVVAFEEGSVGPVSLLGVDTPETYSPNYRREYGDITDIPCLDKWGLAATEFTSEALKGHTVRITLDPAAGALRGWLVAYIEVDGQDFNAALVEHGYARAHIEGESSREQEYLALEQQARARGVGLWECEEAGR